MSRHRKLRPEEEALWQKVADTTDRMHPARPKFMPEEAPKKQTVKQSKPKTPEPIPSFRIGQQSKSKPSDDLLPAIADRIKLSPVHMDRKTFQKMSRGKLVPEARMDLHGMTLAEAHPTLNEFILTSYARGLRLVLVITGKGKEKDRGGPIPERKGALRHQVPQWLRMAPLGSMVMQISEAHLKHGGGGAYYVYLRRRR